MGILIDTSVWSIVLRRKSRNATPVASAMQRILTTQAVMLLGLVRMELLSGVGSREFLELLKRELRSYRDLPLEIEDYELAAAFRTTCRNKGIQGSLADFLLCAAAVRREMAVFTIDRDFKRFARLIPIELHLPHLMES